MALPRPPPPMSSSRWPPLLLLLLVVLAVSILSAGATETVSQSRDHAEKTQKHGVYLLPLNSAEVQGDRLLDQAYRLRQHADPWGEEDSDRSPDADWLPPRPIARRLVPSVTESPSSPGSDKSPPQPHAQGRLQQSLSSLRSWLRWLTQGLWAPIRELGGPLLGWLNEVAEIAVTSSLSGAAEVAVASSASVASATSAAATPEPTVSSREPPASLRPRLPHFRESRAERAERLLLKAAVLYGDCLAWTELGQMHLWAELPFPSQQSGALVYARPAQDLGRPVPVATEAAGSAGGQAEDSKLSRGGVYTTIRVSQLGPRVRIDQVIPGHELDPKAEARIAEEEARRSAGADPYVFPDWLRRYELLERPANQPNWARAAWYLHMAAFQCGDQQAHADLGLLYSLGLVRTNLSDLRQQEQEQQGREAMPEVDHAQALLQHWYGAMAGDEPSQLALAHRYILGQRTTRSCRAARQYLQPVARKVVDMLAAETDGGSGDDLVLELRRLLPNSPELMRARSGSLATRITGGGGGGSGRPLSPEDPNFGPAGELLAWQHSWGAHIDEVLQHPPADAQEEEEEDAELEGKEEDEEEEEADAGWDFSYFAPEDPDPGAPAVAGAEAEVGAAQAEVAAAEDNDFLFGEEGEEAGGGGGFDDEVVAFYNDAAAVGDEHAQLAMGQLHLYGGRGVPRDLGRAANFFQQAAEQHDNPEAHNVLGQMHLNGMGGLAQDREAARQHFLAAAEQGHAGAMYGLGVWHRQAAADGDPGQAAQALEYFRMGAQAGNPEALYQLGALHFSGTGGAKQHFPTAASYFARAAAKGHTPSIFNLAQLYLMGLGVPRADCELGVQLLRVVADRGVWMRDLARARQHLRLSLGLWEQSSPAATADWFSLWSKTGSGGPLPPLLRAQQWHVAADGSVRELPSSAAWLRRSQLLHRALMLYGRLATMGTELAQHNLAQLLSQPQLPARRSTLDALLERVRNWLAPPATEQELDTDGTTAAPASETPEQPKNPVAAARHRLQPEALREALLALPLIPAVVPGSQAELLFGLPEPGTSQKRPGSSAPEMKQLLELPLEEEVPEARSSRLPLMTRMLGQSAHQGFAESLRQLGDLCWYGRPEANGSLVADDSCAVAFWSDAHARRSSQAAFNLGWMYMEGAAGLPSDPEQAKRMLEDSLQFQGGQATAVAAPRLALWWLQLRQFGRSLFGGGPDAAAPEPLPADQSSPAAQTPVQVREQRQQQQESQAQESHQRSQSSSLQDMLEDLDDLLLAPVDLYMLWAWVVLFWYLRRLQTPIWLWVGFWAFSLSVWGIYVQLFGWPTIVEQLLGAV